MVLKYRFCTQYQKFANIVFINEKVINLPQFPNAKRIFQWDETLSKNCEEQIGHIKYSRFNDCSYLSPYVNKYYNNPVHQAERFNYAFVYFRNINYWSQMYYIQSCMSLQGSKLTVQISRELLQQLYNNISIEDCVRLFQQKVMNIGLLSVFQVKPCSIVRNQHSFDLSFISQDKRVEAVENYNRKLLYMADGILYNQQMGKQIHLRPERIIGEVYPL